MSQHVSSLPHPALRATFSRREKGFFCNSKHSNAKSPGSPHSITDDPVEIVGQWHSCRPIAEIMIMSMFRSPLRALLPLLSAALLTACATPVFKDVANRIDATPSDVQQTPERYSGAEIVWGGRIVGVENREDTTEVEVVSYPLDRDQQPIPEAPTQGRFILVLPGYVEAFDYPVGRHLSVHGVLSGTRVSSVQDHEYVYPLVRGKAVNVWPWGFMLDKKPRVSIGVGVGIR
jgi:outer membrane lipoprotein